MSIPTILSINFCVHRWSFMLHQFYYWFNNNLHLAVFHICTWHIAIAGSFTTQHIQTRAGNTSTNMSDKTSPAGSTGGLGVAMQGGKSKNKASPSRARSGSRGHSQSPSPRSRSHSKSRQVKLATEFCQQGPFPSPCWKHLLTLSHPRTCSIKTL